MDVIDQELADTVEAEWLRRKRPLGDREERLRSRIDVLLADRSRLQAQLQRAGVPEALHRRECCYCGASFVGRSRACFEHVDLLDLDLERG